MGAVVPGSELNMNEDIQVLLARMEGKLDRVTDAMQRYDNDMRDIRAKQAQQDVDISQLRGLNVNDRLDGTNARIKHVEEEHDKRLMELKTDLDQRKGIAKAMAVIWAVIGSVTTGVVVTLVKVLGSS